MYTKEVVHQLLEERFYSKINFDLPDKCWLWNADTRRGYGLYRCYINNRYTTQGAHRYMLSHLLPRFDSNLDVLHVCDNPTCVNPNHLKQGTHYDNMQDMKTRKRERHPKGSSCHNAKLSENDILIIRKLLMN